MRKILILLLLASINIQAHALSPMRPNIIGLEGITLCAMGNDPFRSHYGLVSHKNHVLLLDKQGHWHILGKTDREIGKKYICTNTLAAVYQNKQWYIHDAETGQSINPNRQAIEDINVWVDSKYDFIELKQNGKWGVWQKQNHHLIPITPSIYDDLHMANNFSDKRNDVYDADDIQYFQAALNNKWGVVDRRGNWIVPAEHQKDDVSLYKHLILIWHKNFTDVFDFTGKKIMQINTKQFVPFLYPKMKGIVLQNRKTGKYGFMNLQGKWVLPAQYDLIGEPDLNRAVIIKNKREGFINEHGKIVIPMAFDFSETPENYRGGFRLNQEYGIAPVNIGKCTMYVDTDGILIEGTDFFYCPTHPHENEKKEKQKALKLLKSRTYPVKWRQPPEKKQTVVNPTSKPPVKRDPMPILPDEPASE